MSDRLHKREIDRYDGGLTELATEVGRLTYDQVSNFLGALALELEKQAEGDLGRGRSRLAEELGSASAAILAAQVNINRAWDICLPHMRPEELGGE